MAWRDVFKAADINITSITSVTRLVLDISYRRTYRAFLAFIPLRQPHEMATTVPKRARKYRDFLTPALHRKFTRASFLALLLCYCEAIWMGEWDCKASKSSEMTEDLTTSFSVLAMVSSGLCWRENTHAIYMRDSSPYYSSRKITR